MNRDAARQEAIAALTAIAPETRADTLDPVRPLRDQVDLDSMDFLRFLIELQKRTRVSVSEADYGRVATLDAIAEYVATHSGG